jgi:hypothetical protein
MELESYYIELLFQCIENNIEYKYKSDKKEWSLEQYTRVLLD